MKRREKRIGREAKSRQGDDKRGWEGREGMEREWKR